MCIHTDLVIGSAKTSKAFLQCSRNKKQQVIINLNDVEVEKRQHQQQVARKENRQQQGEIRENR